MSALRGGLRVIRRAEPELVLSSSEKELILMYRSQNNAMRAMALRYMQTCASEPLLSRPFSYRAVGRQLGNFTGGAR